MRIRVLVAVIFALLLGEPAAAQVLPIPPGWQMERAILLSRHGVRSPLKSNEELDRHVATPWPVWPVPPGFLTPHGAELMRLMGRYYRVLYGGRGLMEASICPPPNTLRGVGRHRPAHAAHGRRPVERHVSRMHQSAAAQPGRFHRPRSAVPSAADAVLPDGSRGQPRRRAGPHRRQLQFGAARIRASAQAMQATLCPPGQAAPLWAALRPAVGAAGGRGRIARLGRRLRTDRHRLVGGRELPDGKRRRHAVLRRSPGAACRATPSSRTCSRSIGSSSTSRTRRCRSPASTAPT